MASDVDICNEALSYLGDSATVSSIEPPEGSAQAEHCARFYPSVLGSLLELHTWGFATIRVALPLLANNPASTWLYAYAQPNNCVSLLSVLAVDALDDYSSATGSTSGAYTPQNYSAETNAAGDKIILTNQPNAVARYVALVKDATKFSPLFRETLTWMLAAKLAGPVLKGDAGRKAAIDCLKQSQFWYGKAVESDGNQRQVTPQHQVAWLNNR